MPIFSISKIILHFFHVDNYEGELGIGYGMIIGREMTVHIVLKSDFKKKCMSWENTAVPMKETSSLIGQYNLKIREMRKVVMYIA